MKHKVSAPESKSSTLFEYNGELYVLTEYAASYSGKGWMQGTRLDNGMSYRIAIKEAVFIAKGSVLTIEV